MYWGRNDGFSPSASLSTLRSDACRAKNSMHWDLWTDYSQVRMSLSSQSRIFDHTGLANLIDEGYKSHHKHCSTGLCENHVALMSTVPIYAGGKECFISLQYVSFPHEWNQYTLKLNTIHAQCNSASSVMQANWRWLGQSNVLHLDRWWRWLGRFSNQNFPTIESDFTAV